MAGWVSHIKLHRYADGCDGDREPGRGPPAGSSFRERNESEKENQKASNGIFPASRGGRGGGGGGCLQESWNFPWSLSLQQVSNLQKLEPRNPTTRSKERLEKA